MNECLMCPLSKIDGTKRKNKKKKWKNENEKMLHVFIAKDAIWSWYSKY